MADPNFWGFIGLILLTVLAAVFMPSGIDAATAWRDALHDELGENADAADPLIHDGGNRA